MRSHALISPLLAHYPPALAHRLSFALPLFARTTIPYHINNTATRCSRITRCIYPLLYPCPSWLRLFFFFHYFYGSHRLQIRPPPTVSL
jgi:hypothetical protein